MDIQGSNGSSFHLEIVGYQFPQIVTEKWDSNWLNIRMAVSVPQGAWTVTDPFLLTYEVKELADWFDGIAAQKTEQEDEIGFTEPNLWLEVTKLPDGARCLRIHFAIECLPPWANRSRSGRGTEDVFVDFPLSDIDLHRAAESLRSQLSPFPQRAAH